LYSQYSHAQLGELFRKLGDAVDKISDQTDRQKTLERKNDSSPGGIEKDERPRTEEYYLNRLVGTWNKHNNCLTGSEKNNGVLTYTKRGNSLNVVMMGRLTSWRDINTEVGGIVERFSGRVSNVEILKRIKEGDPEIRVTSQVLVTQVFDVHNDKTEKRRYVIVEEISFISENSYQVVNSWSTRKIDENSIERTDNLRFIGAFNRERISKCDSEEIKEAKLNWMLQEEIKAKEARDREERLESERRQAYSAQLAFICEVTEKYADRVLQDIKQLQSGKLRPDNCGAALTARKVRSNARGMRVSIDPDNEIRHIEGKLKSYSNDSGLIQNDVTELFTNRLIQSAALFRSTKDTIWIKKQDLVIGDTYVRIVGQYVANRKIEWTNQYGRKTQSDSIVLQAICIEPIDRSDSNPLGALSGILGKKSDALGKFGLSNFTDHYRLPVENWLNSVKDEWTVEDQARIRPGSVNVETGNEWEFCPNASRLRAKHIEKDKLLGLTK
jgi:hypothetical protein